MLNRGLFLSTVGAAPTWTNLLHWYSFDETTGKLLDLYGSDDGTVTGATQGVSGKINTAYSFDGGDFVTLDTGESLGTAVFSLSFWCYPTTDETSMIGGDENSFQLSLILNRRPRVIIAGAGGVSAPALQLTANAWNFVSLVRSSGVDYRFGVNGSYESEVDDKTLDFTGKMIYLGKSDYDYGPFQGSLDEFNIFSDTKSDSYLTAMYNSGNGTSYSDGDPE